MRISDLSTASGVPIATIKFYLRAGLLPAGRRTAPNQARYDEGHLRRLRLIRAFTSVGRLELGIIKRVLDAVDDPTLPVHEALGVVQRAITSTGDRPADVAAKHEVDDLLTDLGWEVSPTAPAKDLLAQAISVLRDLGREVEPRNLVPYAGAALEVARNEIEFVSKATTREELIEGAVVGTIVYETVLAALRRLAHEHLSAETFGAATTPP